MYKLLFLLILIFCSFFTKSQIDSCLQGDFRFEGNVLDNSTHGISATNNGATATVGYSNDVNSAYYLDGQDDYIVLDNDFDFPNRSVIFWVKVADQIGNNVIYNNDNPTIIWGKNIIAINQDTPDLKLKYNVGKDGNQYLTSIALDKWYYVAFTVDANYIRYYLDGQEIYSGTTMYNAGSVDGGDNTRIGCGRKIDKFFKGSIDNFKVFKCALSATEINHYYVSTKDRYFSQKMLNVYPNPVHDMIRIKRFRSSHEPIRFELYNITGQQIRNELLSSDLTTINRISESNGMYYYKIVSEASRTEIESGILLFQ
ncbi:MAG: T9SS type A sorting domain-containing protein [Bacteroidetes bacterium]|nr:T9SS type A sorting domain-containing protein [Bacteroidota bacterium]